LISDEDLYLDGRETAMTQLIGRYERPLYRFILQMVGDAHLAEDIFQETFLRLHNSRTQYLRGAPLKPYVYRIAMNVVRDARRRKSSRLKKASLDGTADGTTPLNKILPGDTPDPSSNAEHQELQHRIRKAVDGLPEIEREVVLLRVFEGLTFAQIAEITGVALPTAKSRMLYALRRLRPALESAALNTRI